MPSSINGVRKTINDLVKLIEAFDSCRAGKFFRSVAKVEQLYFSLNLKKAPYKWKILQKDILDILDIPKKHPGFEKVVRIHKAANYFSYSSLLGLLLGFYSIFLQNATFFYIFFAFTMIATNTSLLLRLYENNLLTKIYNEQKEKILAKGERLKETIDYLIILLMRQLRRTREIRETRLKLNFIDYENILVIKNPSLFSTRYTVLVKV